MTITDTRLVAGLFGKLPAHGDFVRRGWEDATVDAVDRWLTPAIAAAHATRDDEAFSAWMRAAPLWQGYVPPGLLGPSALFVAIAASVDRVGRFFPVLTGLAGLDEAVWSYARASRFGATLDDAVYDALAARLDADATVRMLTDALEADLVEGADAPPLASRWWLTAAGHDAPVITTTTIDAALLERLLSEGQS